MTRTVDAIFENGNLRLLSALDGVAEQTKVRVTVESTDPAEISDWLNIKILHQQDQGGAVMHRAKPGTTVHDVLVSAQVRDDPEKYVVFVNGSPAHGDAVIHKDSTMVVVPVGLSMAAGCLSQEDASEMLRIIEQEFERVDSSDWS